MALYPTDAMNEADRILRAAVARERARGELRLPSRKNADKLELLGVAEICALLGVHKMTLKRWRDAGRFPAPLQEMAAGPVWSRKEVERWQTSRR